MRQVLLFFFLFGISLLVGQPTQQYSHGDPTDTEQLTLEYINRTRANPAAEGQRLVNSAESNVLNAIDFFGVNLDVVEAAFNLIEPVPPIAFQPQLLAAARKHSQLMINLDQQAHQLPGEGSLRERTQAEGYDLESQNALSENVYAYVEDAYFGHAAFQIDWGFGPDGIQDPPGHRNSIHDIGQLTATEIGIGILEDDNLAGTKVTGPLVMTQDFGRPLDPTFYVLGVVYQDSDGDGFYSLGEGLEGVTLTPSQGDWYAVTSSSGGYAIPLEGVSGSVQLTASGGSLSEPVSELFTTSGQNVKVDFVVSTESLPPVVKNPNTDFGADSVTIDIYVLTSWFGGFFDLSKIGADLGWIYHDEHGSLYYVGDENGLWSFSESLGWAYTDRALYPNIYIEGIGWVFYFEQDGTGRVFYDYTLGQNFFNDPTVNNDLIYF